MSTPVKLRFAVMCDGASLSAWQAQCVEELVESALAEPVLVIRPVPGEAESILGLLKKAWNHSNVLPFRIYNRFWAKRRSKAHQVEGSSDIFGKLPVITCATKKIGRYRERFSNDDVKMISSNNLDFILRFAFNIIEGDILSAAKHGVWSFHHGDDRKYRGSPPGFWECFHGDPLTGVVLQKLTESLDAGQILYRGVYNTDRSYTRNLENIHLRATYFPVRACKMLAAGNSLPSASGSNAKIYREPDFLDMCSYVKKRLLRFLTLLYKRIFFFDIWNVGFVEQSLEEIIRSKNLKHVKWMEFPNAYKGQLEYIADPFAISDSGKSQVLVEHYEYASGKGAISKISLPDAFDTLKVVPAISPKEHLSYPFVFTTKEGKRYCMPESGDANKISLYREQNDGTWTFERDLISDIPALDTTHLHHDEKHWLFFTIKGNSNQLHAYYADQLDSQWHAHSLNPLKDDVSCSRPAGGMFMNGNQLYRPAQDGTDSYGSALRIMRINKLTTSEFDEEECVHLRPDKHSAFPEGLHTINSLANGVLVDGKRYRYMWNGPLLRLRWAKALSQYKRSIEG